MASYDDIPMVGNKSGSSAPPDGGLTSYDDIPMAQKPIAAPKKPSLMQRAADAAKATLTAFGESMAPANEAAMRTLGSAAPKAQQEAGAGRGRINPPVVDPSAPAPKQPAPYRDRREALDDAVNLVEEGVDFGQVASEFGRMGIQRAEIEQHGAQRGSAMFQQQRLTLADSQAARRAVGQQPAESMQASTQGRKLGEIVNDTGQQLKSGAYKLAGAVPKLLNPDGQTAQFFEDRARAADAAQSPSMQARITAYNDAVDAAGKDGALAQIAEVFSQVTEDPALAARLIVSNLPSMIPGLGAAKLAQVATVARGLTAAKAARNAVLAGGAVNATLNAGSARGDAFDDIKRTLMDQGMSEQEATDAALRDSRVSAAVGGLTGAVSGASGLEGVVAKAGAVAARGGLRQGVKAAGAEFLGEQVEEVAPKVATNAMASRYDGRDLTKNIGQTVAETAIASSPGSGLAGLGAAAGGAQPQPADPWAAARAKGFMVDPPLQTDRPSVRHKKAGEMFRELGAMAGIAPGAVERGLAAAQGMPVDAVPGFFARFAQSLQKRGLVSGQIDPDVLAAMTSGPLAPVADQGPEQQPEQVDAGDVAAITGLAEDAQPGAQADQQAVLDAEAMQAAPGVPEVPQGSLASAAAAVALSTPVDAAAHEAATSPTNDRAEPTQAQKDAGNYKVGRTRVGGMDVRIENPQGSKRRGVDQDGTPWETEMRAHYGYFAGTEGADGDKLDVFIKPGTAEDWRGPVFVIDQIEPKTGELDEHKVVMGAADEAEAEQLYRSNYDANWQGLGAMTRLPLPAFKAWAKSGRLKEPLGDISAPRPINTPPSNEQIAPQAPAAPAAPQAPQEAADQGSAAAPGAGAQGPGVPGAGGAAAAQAARLKAQQSKRGREQFNLDPERDSLLQALAKMGGVSRDSVAGEFGLKPEELKHTVSTGKLKAHPFRKTGGMNMDQAITALAEAGYFTGMPEDEHRNAFERAIYDELGGSPLLKPQGQMRQAAQAYNDQQEQDARARDEEDAQAQAELDAEREAIMAEAGLSDGELSAHPDQAIEIEAVAQDIAAGMRALGFTEQEIADELARQNQPDTRTEGSRAQDPEVANRQAQAPPAAGNAAPQSAGGDRRDTGGAPADAGRGQGQESRPERGQPERLTYKLRADGTLAVTGDSAAIKKQLADAGIPAASVMKSATGVVVGKTQATKARQAIDAQGAQDGAPILTSQSADELKAKTEREDAATKAAAAKKVAEQERLRREAEVRDNKARADSTVDDFQLGQSADQQLSGITDMFSPQADSGAARSDEAGVPRPEPAAAAPTPAKVTRSNDGKREVHPPSLGLEKAGRRVIARAGRTPNSTQNIELRDNTDGSVTPWLDRYELLDFESGEPIVLARDVSDQGAVEAIRAAGSLGRGVKIYTPKQEDYQKSATDAREDDAGNVAMFSVQGESGQDLPLLSRGTSDGVSGGIGGGILGIGENPSAFLRPSRAAISAVDLDVVVAVNLKGWRGIGLDRIVAVDHWTGLPQEILQDAKQRGFHAGAIEGVVHRGRVYLVRSNLRDKAHAQRVLFHEALGHIGMKVALAGKPTATLNALWDKLNGLAGVAKLAQKYQVGDGSTAWDRLQPYVQGTQQDVTDRRTMIIDELIAFLAQASDTSALTQFKAYMADVKAAIVALLRKLDLNGLADQLDRAGAELDVLQLVRDARQAIQRGKTRDGEAFTLVSRAPNPAFSKSDEVPQAAAFKTEALSTPNDEGARNGASAGARASVQQDRRDGDQGMAFSVRDDRPVALPDVIVANSLAATANHPDYVAAKAGDIAAAVRLAGDLVTPDLVAKVRAAYGSDIIVQPVTAEEAAGRNKIPLAGAKVLARDLGASVGLEVVQGSRAHRTAMDGLGRLFASPEFIGDVMPGGRYLLLDDTLAQGGTFASLASHIQQNGGTVVGAVALTGKQYSAKLQLSPELLGQVRETYSDVELAFRAATGRGFDALTESEARYLAKHKSPDDVRGRIAEAGRQAGSREDGRDAQGPQGLNPSAASGDDADAVFSVGSAVPPEKQLSQDALEALVRREAPTADAWKSIQVVDGPGAIGVVPPAGAVPSGVSLPGKIYLFRDGIVSEAEAIRTVFHELFHLGLSQSMGQDAYVQRMLRMGSDPLVQQYASRWKRSADGVARKGAMPVNNWHALAVEEALADIAEELHADRQGIGTRGNIPQFVRTAARWLADVATEVLGLPNVASRIRRMTQSEAERFVVDTIGAVRFDAPSQLSGSRFRSGNGTPATPTDDTRFSAAPGDSTWVLPEGSKTDDLIYELQDGRIDLKRAQEAITRAGGQIEQAFDARLRETLFPGRVAARSTGFLDAEVRPLLEVMARNQVSMNELSDYLHARGARERNAQIAKVNPELPDGGAGKNTQGVLMTNAAAKAHVDAIRPARRDLLNALAKRVDTITAGTRTLLVDEGLESPEVIAAWEAAYPNYIPMFRDEAEAGNPHPIGTGMSVRGSASKRATGSTKEVTNILAHVLMQREAAITRAEKNRVAVSLYGLALTNPNKKVWATIRPGMTNAQIEVELRGMGVDPDVAAAGMEKAPTVRTVDEVSGKVVNRLNPLYKSLPGAIVVRIKGEDRVLMLNQGNPRALRMAENLKNMDGLTKLDLAGSMVGQATRWMASVNTAYNPVFGLVNVTRDTLGAAVNLSSTPLRGKSIRVLWDTPAALQGIGREIAGLESGGWGALYRQFQEDGGQTGYRDLFLDANARTKELESALNSLESRGLLNPKTAGLKVLAALEGFNTVLENGVRLSAYKAALDQGMPRDQAAKLARELTVDFNRKGRMTRELGPLFAFFNASVQGSARTIEALRGPAGRRILLGGVALGVLQAAMLAVAGYEDDEVPEFIKARAFIIPLGVDDDGVKKWAAIPLPLGLHVLPNTGRVLTEVLMSSGDRMGERVFGAVGEIAGAFNPLGGGNIFTLDGALKTVAPTVVDPFIELATNKNFAGVPIEKEPRSRSDVSPGFARAREKTLESTSGQAYLGISKALNRLTGGDEYEAGAVSPTPERLRYLAQVVGGGLLREIEKVVDATSREKPVESHDMPLIGRFYGKVDDEKVQRRRYFDNVARIEQAEAIRKAAENAGDEAKVSAVKRDRPEVEFYDRAREAKRDLKSVEGAYTSSVDADRAEHALMKSFNTDVKSGVRQARATQEELEEQAEDAGGDQ